MNNLSHSLDHLAALYALQCVKAFCGDEIAGLFVPGDSRTLDKIIDDAIKGLMP